jgi:DNA polymerase-1
MNTPEKFFVFDISALIYKAYFAMSNNPMKTSKGINVSTVHGVANQVLAVITKEKPDYLAIAYDTKEPTFRHVKYPEYKAQRAEMPEELVAQIPLVKRMITAMSMPSLEMPGWEADDIIGTILEKIKGKNIHLYIVSGDKDFMQLINDQCSLYTIKKGQETEILSYEGVKNKFNCKPEQVVDVLAMMGDASDNVPGIAGVGEKTALKFIELYGSLENLYNNVGDVKGKLQEKIINSKDLAFLSRDLVTIRRDCPIELNWKDLKFHTENITSNPDVFAICKELEFSNLGERIKNISKGNYRQGLQVTPPAIEPLKVSEDIIKPTPVRKKKDDIKPAEDITVGSSLAKDEVHYHLIKNSNEWQDCRKELKAAKFVIVDTETDGLDCISNQLAGFSFAIREKEAWYLPLNYPGFTADKKIRQSTMAEVKEILENPFIEKGGQNIKFDYRTILKENIKINPITFDTMIASHLVNQKERMLGIDDMALAYLGYTKIKTQTVMGEGMFETKMTDLPAESVYLYACEDADITYRVSVRLREQLKAMEMDNLFCQIEMPLISVLGDMEQEGVFVEKSDLKILEKEFEEELIKLTKQAHELAGEVFNVDSPRELGQILFDKLEVHKKVAYKPKANNNGWSTAADVLEKLLPEPLPVVVSEYRTIKKLQSTYIKALPEMINPVTNRIHSHFNQFIAQTGRLSSDKPNLQNIPIRGSEGRRIRKAFKAQNKEYIFGSADYSQIELRVLAHLAQDKNMIEAFKSSADIHTSTAAKIFGKDPADITREDRSRAKAINFGIIYGMGANRLARENGVTLKEAKSFIDNYKATFPQIDEFFNLKIDEARKTEYVSTFFGRKRLLENINTSGMDAVTAMNMAKNTPIQGTAAEIIKMAMIKLHAQIAKEKLPIRLIGQVHDELLFEIKKDFIDQAKEIIKSAMSNVVKWDVDLLVEIGVGDNWLDAH